MREPMNGPGPTSHIYFAQRLRLHYVDWGNPEAPPLVLVHGGRDHARSWDAVARALRAEYHTIAPDLRGHGDSQWVIGAAYSLTDNVADLAQLIEQQGWERVHLIGHSRGASIVLCYAGLYPERVRRVIAIEARARTRNVDADFADRPVAARYRAWVDAVRTIAARQPHRYPTLADAAARMRQENPRLSPEQAHHLAAHGAVRNEDGAYTWKFDNYARLSQPHGLTRDEMHEIWSQNTAPTLLLQGTGGWTGNPAEDGRLRRLPNARSVMVEGAGHWLHHDRLEEFLRLVRTFLAEPD